METIHCVWGALEKWAREEFGDKWDSYISQFPEAERAAVVGYIHERSFWGDGDRSCFVSPDDFRSLFQGEWSSFEGFARVMLEDDGISATVIERLGSYFDLNRYILDLSEEYYTVYTSRGTVWVYAVEW